MIYFVVQHKNQGSSILRGLQISNELNNLDIKSKVINPHEVPTNEENAIFFWVKNINLDIIKRCRKTSHHIYDIVDNYIFNKHMVNSAIKSGFLDRIIVNNFSMKRDFSTTYNISLDDILVIHHNWDPRIASAIKENQNNLTFGYLGSIASLSHSANFLHYKKITEQYNVRFYDSEIGLDVTDPLKADKKIPNCSWNKNAMSQANIRFNCHVSIREENSSLSKYKTSAKVVTASALSHNIITTYEDAVKDILPSEYPFILKNTDLESVIKMFDLVKKDFNCKKILWNRGLEIMSCVKGKYSITNTIKNYSNFINIILQKI